MSPGLIIALMMVAGTAGGLFYSYHIGRTQGENICNTEKLEAQLEKNKAELLIQEQLAQLQQESLGEAQSQIEDLEIRSKTLADSLSKATVGKPQCIPDSVLDELRKFRQHAKDKNS